MNIKFPIRHELFVEKSNAWVANVRELFDYSLPIPLFAGVVVDVRPSLPAETGGNIPTSCTVLVVPSSQAIHIA